MVSYHPEIAVVLVGGVAVISLALTVLSHKAFRRTGNGKLRYVTAAFAVFCAKSLITAYALTVEPAGTADPSGPAPALSHGHLEFLNSALDLAIVLLLVAPFLGRRA